jgi:hypothetical protein
MFLYLILFPFKENNLFQQTVGLVHDGSTTQYEAMADVSFSHRMLITIHVFW